MHSRLWGQATASRVAGNEYNHTLASIKLDSVGKGMKLENNPTPIIAVEYAVTEAVRRSWTGTPIAAAFTSSGACQGRGH